MRELGDDEEQHLLSIPDGLSLGVYGFSGGRAGWRNEQGISH